jgi:hypothetical protein
MMPEITCKFRQLTSNEGVFDVNTVPVLLPEKPAIWRDFDTTGMTVNEFITLFTGRYAKNPVVLRIGATVISNDKATRQLYHRVSAKEGLKVIDLMKLTPSDRMVAEMEL